MLVKSVFISVTAIVLMVACSSEQQINNPLDNKIPIDSEVVKTPLPVQNITLTAATKLFAYQEGIWDSKWDWVDQDGKLLGSQSGVEIFTSILDGTVQEVLNDVPDMGGKSKAVMTYNHAEQKIIFFSMGQKGDYWLMKQDPVTGIMVSEPHASPDGSFQVIRFTTIRKTDNEMDVMMETSNDAGKTWVKLFTQYMVRRTGE